MSSEIATKERISTDLQEKVLLGGDLSKLSTAERLSFYNNVCESLGLNPLTRPFEYITLNGKLTLYARKDCTEQLRTKRGVSITKLDREVVEGIYVVTAHALDKDGRTDTSIGAVPIANLQGEVKANAMMKAETKAKRRVTLSICGLGMLDESEVDSIPEARPHATVMDHKRTAQAKLAELKQEGLNPGEILIHEDGTATQRTMLRVETPQEDGQGHSGGSTPHEEGCHQQALDASAAFIWRLGKHKGESIVTIPDNYLLWAEKDVKFADHREAATAELDRRKAHNIVVEG